MEPEDENQDTLSFTQPRWVVRKARITEQAKILKASTSEIRELHGILHMASMGVLDPVYKDRDAAAERLATILNPPE